MMPQTERIAMPEKTLKQWLGEQGCPAHIAEKLEQLFGLPEKWKKDARSEDGTPERFALLEQSGINWCADTLDRILGGQAHDR